MKKKTLEFYDKFTVKERFDLSLAALARDDQEEVHRLQDSCPQKRYIQADTEFCDRMDSLKHLCVNFIFMRDLIIRDSIVLCSLGFTFSKMAVAFEDGFNLAVETVKDKQSYESVLPLKEEKLNEFLICVDELEKEFSEKMSILKSLIEAFRLFCEEVNINYQQVIEWLEKWGTTEEIFTPLLEDYQIDEKAVESLKNKFLESWQKTTVF